MKITITGDLREGRDKDLMKTVIMNELEFFLDNMNVDLEE
jgi:hypothetical protein